MSDSRKEEIDKREKSKIYLYYITLKTCLPNFIIKK